MVDLTLPADVGLANGGRVVFEISLLSTSINCSFEDVLLKLSFRGWVDAVGCSFLLAGSKRKNLVGTGLTFLTLSVQSESVHLK